MWRIPKRIAYRIAVACGLCAMMTIAAWTYLSYRFLIQAYEAGVPVSHIKIVLGTALPLCVTLLYSLWNIFRYSPDGQEWLRRWLTTGLPFRMGKQKRALAAFDRLLLVSEALDASNQALKTAIAQSLVWQWVAKPPLIGLLGVIAASPLLVMVPVLNMGVSAKDALIAAGVIWMLGTLSYLAARALGILDGHDRRRKKTSMQRERMKVSEYYQASVAATTTNSTGRSVAEGVGPTETGEPRDHPSAGFRPSSAEKKTLPPLPQPPGGFEWKQFRNVDFLQPLSWHVIVQETPPIKDGVGMDVYATSPQRFSDAAPFETGFTIQVMSGMKSGVWPGTKPVLAKYITSFLQRIEKTNVLMFEEGRQKNLEVINFCYRDIIEGQLSVIVHKLIAMSEELETIYVYTFESPESTWQQQWSRYGALILHHIAMAESAPLDLSNYA